jgi:hypothetical protein
MSSSYLDRHHAFTLVRLRADSPWPVQFGPPPNAPGVELLAVEDRGRLLVEIAANLPAGTVTADATAAAARNVRDVDTRAAVLAASTEEAEAVRTAAETDAAARAALEQARADLDSARAAYRDGIRKAPDPQLRANVEFGEARVQDLDQQARDATVARQQAEARLAAARTRIRAQLVAAAMKVQRERRAALTAKVTELVGQAAAELLAVDAIDRALAQ